MAWEFLITDRFGTPIGELQGAPAITVQKPIKRVATGTIQVTTSNPLANALRSLDQALVKGIRNGNTIIQGPVVPSYSKQVNDQSKSILFNFADVGWRLSRRLIPATKVAQGFSYGTALAPVDRGAIWSQILNDINASNDTGIRFDLANDYQTTSATNVGPWYFQNSLLALSTLFSPQDAGEWMIQPVEPTTDATGLYIGRFKIQPAFGGTRPDVVFEYGDGKRNVQSFSEDTDFSGAMNRGYSLPSGFPDNATQQVLEFDDPVATAISGYWYEDVLAADLTSDDMRQKLLQQNVAIRAYPRTIIRLVPTVDPRTGVMPQYGVDFVEGDVVTFRAVEYGVETINALFRIYEVDFSLDENGNETITPILVSTETAGITG